ncbi:hypothetical protein SteCoe_38126 [Stentor coeruleus]|uniref:Uncharacterized protein n=1 Tax=Stentor coeruleus TaxID=5963 RepID=A0A1R2AM35_9CILI|nr:hypothetical protein SteCoe_38126 [Stentor coeruleus]
MGSCALAGKKDEKEITATEVFIYSVHSKTNCLLKYYISGRIERIEFPEAEILPKHSAYTFNHPFAYIIGGSDSENALRNEVIKVNVEEMSLEFLSTLPVSSKHGDAYAHNDYLYYLGGITIQNYTAEPTPFMRLVKDSLCWEVLGENSKSNKNLNISNSLIRPGTCKVNGTVYILGGWCYRFPNENQANTNVYSFDLDTLIVTQIQFEGVNLISPICIQAHSDILVLGGYEGNEPNLNIWILGTKIRKVSENGIPIKGNKPIHKLGGYFIIVGKNSVKKLREDKLVWKNEVLNFENSTKIGEIRIVINSKKLPEAPSRVTIFPNYFDETERSALVSIVRHESRKHSPSNFFNSQMDFDYSLTFQKLPHRELSDINSIVDSSGDNT